MRHGEVYEADLKKEIKKLQRYKDEVNSWLQHRYLARSRIRRSCRGDYKKTKAVDLTKIIDGVVEVCHSVGAMHEFFKAVRLLETRLVCQVHGDVGFHPHVFVELEVKFNILGQLLGVKTT